MSSEVIGIDFDNTIVSYNEVFYKVALEKKIIPPEIPVSKGAVRDYLRSIGRENEWTELQGYVYGARMDLASPYSGVDQFLSLCHAKQIPSYIISHKTRTPFLGPKYDLHLAAKTWLKTHKFDAIPSYFELTLGEKLERIGKQNCSIFIDDLPEVLEEEKFPPHVMKILFDPHSLYAKTKHYTHVSSWREIIQLLNL